MKTTRQAPFINTPLQRGAQRARMGRNRFSGLPTMTETAEAVMDPSATLNTLLKQGVNEIGTINPRQ